MLMTTPSPKFVRLIYSFVPRMDDTHLVDQLKALSDLNTLYVPYEIKAAGRRMVRIHITRHKGAITEDLKARHRDS